MYSPSLQTLGQYIRRQGSNVVGSQYSIPIRDAAFLAAGSYSSAVAVLSSGRMTRSLGAYPTCFRVLYTTAAQPRPDTRFRISPACPAGMLSRSSVRRSLPWTYTLLRRSFRNVPPTNPPTSFRSDWRFFGIARYCSIVSGLRTGVFSFSAKSAHMISLFGQ